MLVPVSFLEPHSLRRSAFLWGGIHSLLPAVEQGVWYGGAGEGEGEGSFLVSLSVVVSLQGTGAAAAKLTISSSSPVCPGLSLTQAGLPPPGPALQQASPRG